MCRGFGGRHTWFQTTGWVQQFERYRSAHPEGRMATLAVVEDL
jgi:hypothetical protein